MRPDWDVAHIRHAIKWNPEDTGPQSIRATDADLGVANTTYGCWGFSPGILKVGEAMGNWGSAP